MLPARAAVAALPAAVKLVAGAEAAVLTAPFLLPQATPEITQLHPLLTASRSRPEALIRLLSVAPVVRLSSVGTRNRRSRSKASA